MAAAVCRLVQPDSPDGEFDAELESHLQMHIEDNLRAGMTPAEARRRALINLEGEPTKEAFRDQRGLPLVETFWKNIRYAVRQLFRTLDYVDGRADARFGNWRDDRHFQYCLCDTIRIAALSKRTNW